jgi:nicotinamidase-related amidase
MADRELSIPPHFDPEKCDQVFRVEYQALAEAAEEWAAEHRLAPVSEDRFRIGLLLVDVQNTFCIPGFELFVGGRSGTGAVDDNRRLCRFIYRNLGRITRIIPTMDTHQAIQIFHTIYLVDETGAHPEPHTRVPVRDIENGKWKFNRLLASALGIDPDFGQRHLLHYARSLRDTGKYELITWPYHAMLGGIGHALVSSVEEALFFHSIARYSQPDFRIKGGNPLTEHYSVLGPEVTEGPEGEEIARKDRHLIERLLEFDAVLVAGQAKSHCVAWTIDDLLSGIGENRIDLAQKIYLLEDCTSPVVIPNVVDFSEPADSAFRRFAEAGMNVVRSEVPIENWPGIRELSKR